MGKKINIAIVGLGRVGSTFLDKLIKHKDSGISVAAAAEIRPHAPGVTMAQKQGIPIHRDAKEIVDMGDKIDIIFDLAGDFEARKDLRMSLVRSKNAHTVIAPEIIAFLIWGLIAAGGPLPDLHEFTGY